jgi:adenylate cyclase
MRQQVPPDPRMPLSGSASPYAPASLSAARARRFGWLLLATAALVPASEWVAPRFDAWLYDAETTLLRHFWPQPAAAVAVVGIDQATVDAIAAPIALWHVQLGAALTAIAQARPRLVAVDVVLPERSFDSVVPGLDRALLKGIVAARGVDPAGGVVLALQPDASGRLRPIHLPFVAAAGEGGTGVATYRVEVDGVVRYLDPEVSTFVGVIAQRLGTMADAGFIDYTRGAAFDYVPLIEVLKRNQDGDATWLAKQFAGKVVVLGSVLPLTDRREQPAHLAAWEAPFVEPPGVLIHAQAVRTLLADGFIRAAPRTATVVLAVAFALLALIAGAVARWLALAVVLTGSLVAAALAMRSGVFVPLAAAWITGTLAVAGRSAYDAWRYLRERDRVARLFSGYVSPQVFDGIVDGRLAARGRAKLAFLFADVRDVTTMTEQTAPDDVLDLLNRYFAAVTPILHRHGATIDSFRGDGVTALFGAPETHPDAPGAALRTARDMLAALASLNEELVAAGHAPLKIGIGLAYGEAVFGDLGSPDRRDFTAIGDEVNLAARLQDLTKHLGCPILLTDGLRAALAAAEQAELVDFGVQPIRGHTPIRVWGWRPA